MKLLHESLLILNHFSSLIETRNEFCKRHIGFTVEGCISSKLIDSMKKGDEENPLKNQLTQTKIAEECSDTKINIHNYLCLNIIDMFSFDDEYVKYFNKSLTKDIKVAERIRTFKIKNKNLRNQIDWKELKKYRNIILAHNLRDKKQENRLSFNTLINLNKLIQDIEMAINYCETATKIFNNIKQEFKIEFNDAQKALNKYVAVLNKPTHNN